MSECPCRPKCGQAECPPWCWDEMMNTPNAEKVQRAVKALTSARRYMSRAARHLMALGDPEAAKHASEMDVAAKLVAQWIEELSKFADDGEHLCGGTWRPDRCDTSG